MECRDLGRFIAYSLGFSALDLLWVAFVGGHRHTIENTVLAAMITIIYAIREPANQDESRG